MSKLNLFRLIKVKTNQYNISWCFKPTSETDCSRLSSVVVRADVSWLVCKLLDRPKDVTSSSFCEVTVQHVKNANVTDIGYASLAYKQDIYKRVDDLVKTYS